MGATADTSVSHRDRLLMGMADSVREHGLRGTTVAEVVRRAKTSRRTFYEHFSDREECYLALSEVLTEALQSGIASAADPAKAWDEQVEAMIEVWLQLSASEPALVRSFMTELPGLGDRGVNRQRETMNRFAATLVQLSEDAVEQRALLAPLSFDVALVLVGGLRELEIRAMEEERDVMELRPVVVEIIKSLLQPA